MTPRQRDVWLAELDPTVGHEQAGHRPVIVVSVNQLNEAQPPGLAIVVPSRAPTAGSVSMSPSTRPRADSIGGRSPWSRSSARYLTGD